MICLEDLCKSCEIFAIHVQVLWFMWSLRSSYELFVSPLWDRIEEVTAITITQVVSICSDSLNFAPQISIEISLNKACLYSEIIFQMGCRTYWDNLNWVSLSMKYSYYLFGWVISPSLQTVLFYPMSLKKSKLAFSLLKNPFPLFFLRNSNCV